jgi:hypothetical protein
VLAAISLSIWMLATPLPTLNSPAVNGPAQIGHAGAQQVARAADVARWEAVGQFYATQQADFQSARDADAARWEAMGQFYATQQADTARWEAMGEFYAGQVAVKYGPPGR